MVMKSVCFTGHRTAKITPTLEKHLANTLEFLISKGITDFYAGGAYGFDIICELTVIKMKKRYPQIKLHLILPCFAEEQTVNWNDMWKRRYNYILNNADSVEYVSEHYTGDCMKKRNARLVELADCCVCCYNENNRRSGTGQTLRMAREKGIEIINLLKCY